MERKNQQKRSSRRRKKARITKFIASYNAVYHGPCYYDRKLYKTTRVIQYQIENEKESEDYSLEENKLLQILEKRRENRGRENDYRVREFKARPMNKRHWKDNQGSFWFGQDLCDLTVSDMDSSTSEFGHIHCCK